MSEEAESQLKDQTDFLGNLVIQKRSESLEKGSCTQRNRKPKDISFQIQMILRKEIKNIALNALKTVIPTKYLSEPKKFKMRNPSSLQLNNSKLSVKKLPKFKAT
jgi:hypothetical protein